MSNEDLVTADLAEMETVSFDFPVASLIAASIYFELRGFEVFGGACRESPGGRGHIAHVVYVSGRNAARGRSI